jgi:hypothetical protein
MNTFTHLGISLRIYNALKEKTNICLNKSSFMFGNIKPDIAHSLVLIPHFKKDATTFVASEIENLMNVKINPYTTCTKEFSEKIGVVTHYISDFFCHVHSNHYNGNTFNHHCYEMNLSAYCWEHGSAITSYTFDKFKPILPDFSSICKYIDDLHLEYLQISEKPSFERDMKFALGAAISICVNLITACLDKCEVIAA